MADKLGQKIDQAVKRDIKILKEDEKLEEEIERQIDGFIDRLEEREKKLINKLESLDEIYQNRANSEGVARVAAEISDNIHSIQEDLKKFDQIGQKIRGGDVDTQIQQTVEELNELDQLLAQVMQEAQN